jgi:uncharacterized cupredoxin-like copper-binding protein
MALSRILPLASLGAVLLVGCKSDRQNGAAVPSHGSTALGPPNIVTFTATDYAFDGPSQIPAGSTRFQLVNKGAEPHHLIVVRLEQGRTFDSLAAALKKPGPPPVWAHPVGGPNAPSPGGESNGELVLGPGHHAIICLVPTSAGVPHFAKGMARSLEVTPGPGSVQLPAADITVKLNDYAFELSKPLTSGRHVIRVENAGSQLHELLLARLEPGKTAEQQVAYELAGRKGKQPGSYIGGAAPLAPGDVMQFEVTFEPGEYALICYIPDAKDGKPHTAHGMVRTINVG